MERRQHAAKSAALFGWWDRGSTEAKARRNRPTLENLESRRLLAAIAEFHVPSPSGTASAPDGIVSVPKGDIWFTEFGADKIGSIDPTTHVFSQFPIPTPNSEPLRIALGSDGNLWFTEFGASQIGMINPTTDKITEFPLSPGAQPFDITAGPNNTLWFTEWSGNQIGTITTSGQISSVAIPTGDSVPEGITADSHGNIWFTESLGNKIGMIDTGNDNALTEIPLPTAAAQPYGITVAPGGNVWFTEYSGNQIGMYSPSKSTFSEFKIPTAFTEPTEIVADSQGNLWFTQSETNEVGEYSPATQAFTEVVPATAISGPRGITARADGAIWFTQVNSGEIARIAPSVHIVLTSPPPTTLTSGAPLGLTVTVEFDSGAVDTGYTGSVTATAIGASTAGAGALAGTTTVVPANGVATFAGLSLNEAGSYSIQVNTSDASPVSIGSVLVTSPVVVSPPPVLPPYTPPTAPIPVLTSERLVMAGRGKNRYVAGIVLSFSSPLAPATARDTANYTVIQVPATGTSKAIKPVRLRVVYKASGKTVRLSLSGKPRFAAGGQLIVNASKPNGITSPGGVPLEGNTGAYAGASGLYTILPNGRGMLS